MKLFRFFLRALVITAICAGVILVVVFSPITQTWLVRRTLAQHPELHATVESVWAGWSKVQIDGLAVEQGGRRLTAGSVEIELPVIRAWRERRFSVHRLVAKNWSVKWTREAAATAKSAPVSTPAATAGISPTVKPGAAPAEPAKTVANEIFAGLLGSLEWPADLTVEEVDLEGELLATSPAGETTTQVHLTMKGGPIAAGGVGKFALEASIFDDRLPGNTQAVRGELTATLGGGRRWERIDLKGELTAGNRAAAAGSGWAVTLSVARETNAETYRLSLEREKWPLARIDARWPAPAGGIAGEWTIDARAEDFAALGVAAAVPARVGGGGHLEISQDFQRVRLAGDLRTASSRWPAPLAAWLGPLGNTELVASFDLTRDRDVTRVEQLRMSLAGEQPLAEVHATQSLVVGEQEGQVKVMPLKPDTSWLEVTVHRWPLRELIKLPKDFAIEGGDVAGEFAVGGADGAWTLRSETPFTSAGLTVTHGGRLVAQGLDATLAVTARRAATGAWSAEMAPLVLARGGRELAKVEAKLTQPAERGQPVAWTALATADLVAIRAAAVNPQLGWLTARTATAEISGTIEGYVDFLAKVKIAGHDPTHTLETTLRADLYPDGTVAIGAPLKMTFGKDVSELRVDWEWRGDAPSRGVDLKLAGPNVSLAHLRLLTTPLVVFGRTPGAMERGDGATARPFWGDWTGRVRVDLEHLRLADRELIDVGGYLKIEHTGVQLMGGHGGAPEHSLAQVEATLTFDPARAQPYEFKGAAGTYHVDEETILGKTKEGKEPVFKGRFAVDRAVLARGKNLEELIAGREEEFKLTGVNGIVRLLKTGVAQALPSAPESAGVVNALSDVGTGFARLLGAKTRSITSGQVKVGAVTDAVLDYDSSMAEIGYDSLTIEATQHADGTIGLRHLELISPELHLSGAGTLGGTKDTALLARPVTGALTLGVKGRMAELLTKAGLVSGKKDAQDFALVEPAIQFGGTVGELKQDEWRARLVEAAKRPSPPEKEKSEPEPAKKKRGR